MLIGIVKNSVNEPFVVSFIVNKHSNEIQSIDVLYAVNAKKNQLGVLNPRRFRHLLLVLQLVYSICSIMSIIIFPIYFLKMYLSIMATAVDLREISAKVHCFLVT